MSETPPQYRLAPPTLGQHTDEILEELLDFNNEQIQILKDGNII